YSSRIYTKKNTEESGIYYTEKDGAVYAISTAFPFKEVFLNEVDYSPELKASLLGSDEKIEVIEKDGKALLVIPPLNPDCVKSEYLYTFKLEK
ncbi:MAG: hypothetical protein IKH13_08210, partial [Clostridia bacterium]|nr:hypothetical protein [Clostridia bacterium]